MIATQQLAAVPDEEVVERVLAGETAMFEILMRRHNQRVYRAARAIVRDDAEAEDIMQDAYVRAFRNLHQFEQRAKFSTWLTRIAVHEALARHGRQSRFEALDDMDDAILATPAAAAPDENTFRGELRDLLQHGVDDLPPALRGVFMLREVEDLSTHETAEVLGISEENVKIRLFRARAALREWLEQRVGGQARTLYEFGAARCDRVVAAVLARISS